MIRKIWQVDNKFGSADIQEHEIKISENNW